MSFRGASISVPPKFAEIPEISNVGNHYDFVFFTRVFLILLA